MTGDTYASGIASRPASAFSNAAPAGDLAFVENEVFTYS